MAIVYLGIGSNQQPDLNIAKGLQVLADELDIKQISPWYQSPALGFEGPDFINLVVKAETDLTLTELVILLKQIEIRFGRAPNAAKYSSRALDIDVVMYDQLVGEFAGQTLPRSDIWRFAFVLKPLLDIDAGILCPKSGHPAADYWPLVSQQPVEQVEPAGTLKRAPQAFENDSARAAPASQLVAGY